MNAFLISLAFLPVLLSGVCEGLDFQLKNHNYEEMLAVMNDVHDKCKAITNVYHLPGQTVQGRTLAVISFSSKPGQHVVGRYLFI